MRNKEFKKRKEELSKEMNLKEKIIFSLILQEILKEIDVKDIYFLDKNGCCFYGESRSIRCDVDLYQQNNRYNFELNYRII